MTRFSLNVEMLILPKRRRTANSQLHYNVVLSTTGYDASDGQTSTSNSFKRHTSSILNSFILKMKNERSHHFPGQNQLLFLTTLS